MWTVVQVWRWYRIPCSVTRLHTHGWHRVPFTNDKKQIQNLRHFAPTDAPLYIITIADPELFQNAIFCIVFWAFVEFNTCADGNEQQDAVNRSIVWVSRKQRWIAVILFYRKEKQTCGGHLHKLYSDTYGKYQLKALNRLVVHLRVYVEYFLKS